MRSQIITLSRDSDAGHAQIEPLYYIMMVAATAAFLIERQEVAVILFPPGIVLLQLIRRLQMRRSSLASPCKNEPFNDLRRVR